MDYGSEGGFTEDNKKNRFSGIPSFIKAALICAVPFIIIVVVNYLTVGISACIMIPLLLILYAVAGILAVKFNNDSGSSGKPAFIIGALGGGSLWVISAITNTIAAIVTGGLTLGVGLVLGIPYLLCVVPVELIIAGVISGLSGLIFNAAAGRGKPVSTGDGGDLYG